MANNIPFQIMGKTTRIDANAVANTVSILSDSPCNQVRIHNGSAVEVFLRLGTSSGDNAVIPTAGTPAYSTILHNNSTVVFTAPKQAANVASLYVSVITASANAVVYVTPGEGM
jgi:hypothetical protein